MFKLKWISLLVAGFLLQVDNIAQAYDKKAYPPSISLSSSLERRPKDWIIHFLDNYQKRLQLPADILQKRYERMFVRDVVNFYQATPSVFFVDMKSHYEQEARLVDNLSPHAIGPIVFDAHFDNFGLVRHSDGQMVYAVNDFDQAYLSLQRMGSFEIDLIRLAVSYALLLQTRQKPQDNLELLIQALVDSYIRTLQQQSSQPARSLTQQSFVQLPEIKNNPRLNFFEDPLNRSKKQSLDSFLAKFITVASSSSSQPATDKNQPTNLVTYQFKADSQMMIYPIDLGSSLGQRIDKLFAKYVNLLTQSYGLRFSKLTLKAAAQKLSGGSTFGLPRYYVLLQDNLNHQLRMVEFKQLLPSPDLSVSGELDRADASKIVTLQKQLGGYFNPFTQGFTDQAQSFLVRELEHERVRVVIDEVPFDSLVELVRIQARLLALAHTYQQVLRADAIMESVLGCQTQIVQRLLKLTRLYQQQVQTDFECVKKDYANKNHG